MSKKTKKQTEERKDYHHLGSPDVFEVEYSSENMEYTIVLGANCSNTTFLGEHVQKGDLLFLGLSDEDAESLCEQLIHAISNRLKKKLERYNEQKKLYWMQELDGKEEDWDESGWNSFKQ
jgi:hypothetical protein